MKPVMQSILLDDKGPIKGDCFRACVASIMELPIDALPNFCSLPPDWWERFGQWLRERGWACVEVQLPATFAVPFDTWVIFSGKGPRGVMHSVVGELKYGSPSATLVHDPHPSGEFFGDNQPDWAMFLFKGTQP